MDENVGVRGPGMKRRDDEKRTDDANPSKRAATVAPAVTTGNPES
jgi:hypothetical protein